MDSTNTKGWTIPNGPLQYELVQQIDQALTVPGWRRRPELETFARVSMSLPEDAVIVEVGCFFGSGTIALAGGRKAIGSGRVYSVDPFDGSGDDFSIPYYEAIIREHGERTPRGHFENHLAIAKLTDWVEIYQGTAQEAARSWDKPIDLLFLDGDQSPEGARLAFDLWSPWIKRGGIIAIGNSPDREYDPSHIGNRLIVVNEIVPPSFLDAQASGVTTFAIKA